MREMRDVLTKNTGKTFLFFNSISFSSACAAAPFCRSGHRTEEHDCHCLFVLAPAVTSVICYCFPLSRCMRRVAGCGARFSLLFPSLRVKSFQLFLPFPLRARLSVGRHVRTAVPSQWTMGPPCSSVSRCDNLGHKPRNCYLGSNES